MARPIGNARHAGPWSAAAERLARRVAWLELAVDFANPCDVTRREGMRAELRRPTARLELTRRRELRRDRWHRRAPPRGRGAGGGRGGVHEGLAMTKEVRPHARSDGDLVAAKAFGGLPHGIFGVILADPPWRFETRSPKGRGRCPDGDVGVHHYETMTVERIAALPVAEIAAATCRLFLWCTLPHLEAATGVMREWDLPFRSSWVWVKQGNVGTGYWGRSAHEHVLIGARGSGACFPQGTAPPSAFTAPKGRHSEKPAEVHERIDRAWSGVPKIELFAREHRPGWWCWGDEVGVVDPDGRVVRRPLGPPVR